MGFKTANEIRLQPNDTKYNTAFKFPIASSALLNDGTLPYGTVISSVTVTGWYGSTSAPDLLNSAATISGGDTVQVSLDYPTTTLSGITRTVSMSLKFVLTLNSTAKVEEDFHNIIVGDF